MKTAFVSASFAERAALTPALDAIKAALHEAGVRPHVFVEAYHFAPEDARAMMQATLRDLRASDLLVAEATHKAIGVGIEVGAAAAWGLPIVYVRHAAAEPSTTVGGLATAEVIYRAPDDLRQALRGVLANLLT